MCVYHIEQNKGECVCVCTSVCLSKPVALIIKGRCNCD